MRSQDKKKMRKRRWSRQLRNRWGTKRSGGMFVALVTSEHVHLFLLASEEVNATDRSPRLCKLQVKISSLKDFRRRRKVWSASCLLPPLFSSAHSPSPSGSLSSHLYLSVYGTVCSFFPNSSSTNPTFPCSPTPLVCVCVCLMFYHPIFSWCCTNLATVPHFHRSCHMVFFSHSLLHL